MFVSHALSKRYLRYTCSIFFASDVRHSIYWKEYMSKLTREHVLKLAKLSQLELTEDQIEQYQKELSSILDYVERLDAVDVSGLEPTYQVSGLKNVMREDKVVKQQATSDELLKRVPKTDDRYIKVGRMI